MFNASKKFIFISCANITASKIFILLLFVGASHPIFSQIQIKGNIMDSVSKVPLAFVNVGIKMKNVGTTSREDGSFLLNIPKEHLKDTLTFSIVGYFESNVPIQSLQAETFKTIQLREKVTTLNEVTIKEEKLVERKYGIKRRNLLLHFTDGINQNNDVFEIGQLIKLGKTPAHITSVNLHINESRADSATFRINFYEYEDDQPTNRIVEKSIIQKHPVKEGWLRLDLKEHNIQLHGRFIVAIEFIPEIKENNKPVYYEVKLGGTTKSFYRKNSLGQWNRPPHHYCLFVTALVDKRNPIEPDEVETSPTFTIASNVVKDTFSIFVRLPADYTKNIKQNYPVIYHVDGNAYFDPIAHHVARISKNKKLKIEPIIVGIGYKNVYVMDSLRNRDYTFPKANPSDSFQLSGGGEKFYNFIKTELIRHIDSLYRTNTANRTIMGHSLGGYFTLYSLIRDLGDDEVFHNYVAASPSIGYCDNYILKQFENLSSQRVSKKLYITTGEIEVEEDIENSFHHLTRLLLTKGFMQLKPKVHKEMEHMGTAIPSFEEGIEYVIME